MAKAPPRPAEAARPLGFFSLFTLGVNGIVGVGIFYAPAGVARAAPGATSSSVLAMGLTALCISPVALAYAALAGTFEKDGGPVLYARVAFPPWLAFAVGLLAYLSAVSSTASTAAGLAGALLSLGGPALATPLGTRLLGVALTLGLSLVAGAGLVLSARAWAAVTVLKLLPLMTLALVGLGRLAGVFASSALPPPPAGALLAPAGGAAAAGASWLGAALVAAFSFQGFEIVPVVAGEARAPRRLVPAAVLASLGAAAMLYVALQAICVHALGPALRGSSAPLADAASALGGSGFRAAVAAGTSVSALGIAFGMIALTPRYLASLAEGHASPRVASLAGQRRGVPLQALAVTTALVILLVVTLGPSLDDLLRLSSVAVLCQFASASFALLTLALRRQQGFRPRDAWPAPLALLASFLLLAQATRSEAVTALAVVSTASALGVLAARAAKRGALARGLGGLAVLIALSPAAAYAAPSPIVFARPPRMPATACSFRMPLCVHGGPGIRALETLTSAEGALRVLEGALALPAPDPDPDTRTLDVYLITPPPGSSSGSLPGDLPDQGAQTLLASRDVRSAFDRAGGFVLLDARLSGCARDLRLAAALARASLLRVAPGTDDGTARAQAAHLARLVTACASGAVEDAAAFQAMPEQGVVPQGPTEGVEVAPPHRETNAALREASAGPSKGGSDLGGSAWSVEATRGAALFPDWLDASVARQPGALVRALWALAPTRTAPTAAAWSATPNGFDVLRATFAGALGTHSTFDDLVAGFAASRLSLAGVPGAAPAWDIAWPDPPRRLASPAPVSPTGASYVVVRRAGAPAGARLRVEASWEEHASMRLAVLSRDANGRELRRVLVPSVPRATSAQLTAVLPEGADSVVVVLANLGDPAAPFSPFDLPAEPHGWLLTLASADE